MCLAKPRQKTLITLLIFSDRQGRNSIPKSIFGLNFGLRVVDMVCVRVESDIRQAIANSWPASTDDNTARAEWGWKEHYNLTLLVDNMLKNLTHLVIK